MNRPQPFLLVEDNPRDVELTLGALEAIGLANPVEVTRDGADALDYLYCRGAWLQRPAGLPALILLDLKLPRIDGLEVLEVVKRDESLRRVPVVMFTGSNEERDLIDSYGLGVNGYVVKPVSQEEFRKVLGDVATFWGSVNRLPAAKLLSDTSGRAS